MDAFVVVSVTDGVADGRYVSSIMRGKDARQLCERRRRSDATKPYKVVPMIDPDYLRVAAWSQVCMNDILVRD